LERRKNTDQTHNERIRNLREKLKSRKTTEPHANPLYLREIIKKRAENLTAALKFQ